MRNWKEISDNLDRLYLSPLAAEETIEMRAATIEAYIESNNCTWDMVLANLDNDNDNKSN